MKLTLPTAFVVATLASVNAQASSFDTIALPTLNTDLTTWTDGVAYSGLFTGIQTLGGVPFALSTDVNGNNAFFPAGSSPFNMSGNTTLTIQTNIVDPTTAYTLINTAFGFDGNNVGSVTFNTSNNESYTLQLIEGLNVRDHYNGYYINSTSSPMTQDVFGGNAQWTAHLDMQTILLPSSFQSETLTSIVFQSTGLGTGGEPFLAGVTVATATPIPAAIWMVGSALFGLGGFFRRKMA